MNSKPLSFDRRLYLICYDIVDNKRRNRVAKILTGYGVRVQKSVFECFLNEKRVKEIRQKLRKVIKAEEDQIRLYDLGAVIQAPVECIGLEVVHRYQSVVVV